MTTVLVFCMLMVYSLTGSLNGQTRESILRLIQTEKETIKLADLYAELSDAYFYDNIDSALYFATKANAIAKQYKDTTLLAHTYDQLGFIHETLSHFQVAKQLHLKSLELHTNLVDTGGMARANLSLGYITSYSNNHPGSLKFFLNALQLAEAIQDSFILSDAYYNLASFYQGIPNYEMAAFFYQKTAEMEESIGSDGSLASTYATLAFTNTFTSDFEAANRFARLARLKMQNEKDLYFKGFTASLLSKYYLEINQPDTALVYINLCYEFANKIPDESLIADVYEIRSKRALLLSKPNEALEWCEKALNISYKLNDIEGLRDLKKLESEIYADLQWYEKAHTSLELSNAYTDSLQYDEVARILGLFEQKRRTEQEIINQKLKHQLENQQADFQLELAHKKLIISYFLAFFLILIIVLVIIYQFTLSVKNKTLKAQNRTILRQTEKLEESLSELEQSRLELESLNAQKDKFFSILAHDLKNPFNTLIGYSELLMEDKELRHSDNFDRIAKHINNSAEKGHNLLINLLQWAQSQTGHLDFSPKRTSLKRLIEHDIAHVQEIANAKNIKINLVAEEAFMVNADENMMHTILRNLLTNATKFSYPDSVVQVKIYSVDHEVFTEITDQGIGMSKEEAGRLFSYDSKNRRPGTNNEKGSGLGLILCREFLQYHKGSIWVESMINRGSTFTFKIPDA